MKDVEIMSNISVCLQYKGDQLVAKRKNERFKRIKGSTLAKLLQESNNDESVYNLADMQSAINNGVPDMVGLLIS